MELINYNIILIATRRQSLTFIKLTNNAMPHVGLRRHQLRTF